MNRDVIRWIGAGQRLKDYRVSKRITLRKACTKLNLDVMQVTKMERGCIEPDMDLYDEL